MNNKLYHGTHKLPGAHLNNILLVPLELETEPALKYSLCKGILISVMS